ncbi:hypothetical protein Ancab_014532 [Ancistrocladus abbreviatus]
MQDVGLGFLQLGTLVIEEQRIDLEVPMDMAEIKNAVFSILDTKAPGLDGLWVTGAVGELDRLEEYGVEVMCGSEDKGPSGLHVPIFLDSGGSGADINAQMRSSDGWWAGGVEEEQVQLSSLEEVAFSLIGGKDSTVLFHLLRAAYLLHKKEEKSLLIHIPSFLSSYQVQLDIIRQDFKSGLEALLKSNPIRAIFLGVRIGDPTAVGQEQFSPSSTWMATIHESESHLGLVLQRCMGLPFEVQCSLLLSL